MRVIKQSRQEMEEKLNTALATELVCTLRYKHHYYMASGEQTQGVANEFLEHANEEQDHAKSPATRIVQLGGVLDLSSQGISERSPAEDEPATTLPEMVRDNLVAERMAIDSYRDMIQYLGKDDPTTRRMLEDILAVEEEHADDLSGLMKSEQF